MDNPTIIIGSKTAGVSISVRHRTYPGACDYDDGNWLSADIGVAVGRFRGWVDANLRAEEFVVFHEQLAALHASATGEAEFATLEDWINLQFIRDATGHIECEGWVCDEPGVGNRLSFRLQLDQAHVPNMLHDIGAIIEAYPVIGRP